MTGALIKEAARIHPSMTLIEGGLGDLRRCPGQSCTAATDRPDLGKKRPSRIRDLFLLPSQVMLHPNPLKLEQVNQEATGRKESQKRQQQQGQAENRRRDTECPSCRLWTGAIHLGFAAFVASQVPRAPTRAARSAAALFSAGESLKNRGSSIVISRLPFSPFRGARPVEC